MRAHCIVNVVMDVFLLQFFLILHIEAIPHHPFSEEFIYWINSNQTYWKAGKNFDVSEWDRLKDIAPGVWQYDQIEYDHKQSHQPEVAVPENFTAAVAWPNCKSITQIWDQSQCGSCWALSATATMSDRVCIHSGQNMQVFISAEDLLSCCPWCGTCSGGSVFEAWKYWQEYGIVTGGVYNSSQGCKDYSLPPCEHHVMVAAKSSCKDLFVYTPRCTKFCTDSSISYMESKTFGGAVKLFDNEKDIQVEIFHNGPVEAVMHVYEDFYNYKSGVYKRTGGQYVGKHAVKILGWGIERNLPYWLCANTWNQDWGNNGFFKILRGLNHCGIESQVFASLPQVRGPLFTLV